MEAINIEFYGLPGSGKSTISHELAKKLRNQGYKVLEPSYTVDNKNIIIRKTYKLIKYIELCITEKKIYKEMNKLIIKNGYKGKERIKQLMNIAYKYLIYKKQKNSYIYIWDEGFIQSSISLSMYSKKMINNNINGLKKIYNKDVCSIYISADINNVIKRMAERTHHKSRVENKELKEKQQLLRDLEYCCESIKSDRKIISNYNNINLEIEINYIMKYINGIERIFDYKKT